MKKFSKVLCLLLSVLLMVTVFTACGEEKAEKGKEPAKEVSFEELKAEYAEKTAEDLLKGIKDRSNPTLDEYVELLNTYAYVDYTDTHEFVENATTEAIYTLQDEGATLPYATEFAPILLESDNINVRAYAYESFSGYVPIEDNEELTALLKEKAKTETDPFVISCVLKGLSNALSDDPEFGEYLVTQVDNENARNRYWLAYALGFVRYEDNEKQVDAIIKLMQDSDVEVKKMALKEAGGFYNEKVIDPIVEVLNDDAAFDCHGDAVDSLVDLWFDFPFHENTSEAAYKATMDYLKKSSDNENIPYWTAVISFNTKGSEFDSWQEKATYFDVKEVVQVMTNIFKNENLDDLARKGAMTAISIYGTSEDVKALKATIDAMPDGFDKDSYTSSYDTALAEASEK